MSISTTAFSTQIVVDFGHLGDIIHWCQNNCECNWKYDIINMGGKEPGIYEFVFEDEKDYVKFLMWKK